MDLTMSRQGDPDVTTNLTRRMISEINTSIPGEIISFDPEKQVATVRPCIKSTIISGDGSVSYRDCCNIALVPVMFPYSTESKFSLTFPIKKGDQGLIIFSQKGFDNWLEHGSFQNPPDSKIPRTHNYNDAIFIPGLIPDPKAIPTMQMDGIELRNKKRKKHIKITDSEIEIWAVEEEDQSFSKITLKDNGTISISSTAEVSLESKNGTEKYATKIEEIESKTCTIGSKTDIITSESRTLGMKNEKVLGSYSLSVTGISSETLTTKTTTVSSWGVTCPLTEFSGTVNTGVINSNMYQTVNKGTPYTGVTGAAGATNILTFVNGLCVKIQ